MKEHLAKAYDPKEFEDKWYAFWEAKGYFHAEPNSDQTPYSIVIPPPNVTSVLHMGHGLNNTIQDILIRWKRMQGYNAMWMPGTDHAGIATQNVVERQLAKEGRTRYDIGREQFIDLVWKWKENHGTQIINQLKKMGCSCDWERERFTMDEGLSKAVRETFVTLYEDGLIYRGKYIINWCPRCETALSDEEAEHQDVSGHFYHFRYPLENGDFVEIATTRPETMLGDTAVAVNPTDERYTTLVGKTATLPLVNRKIPIIADDYVDKDFGTGVVKITPAHDPNDYWIGERHNLEKINIMTPQGKINENAPERYVGMDRFEARKKIVEDMEREGLLIKIVDHNHSVGHCYRCGTMVEPYLSDQWFIKMKPLAEPALEASKNGSLKFYPDRWRGVYDHWLENVRDWCVSRQIWWGHRVPAWYCKDCNEVVVSREDPTECPKCQSKNIVQDSDVLDTWASSWLWPFSTLGWPEKTKALEYYYPTNVLSTAPEILFFWVARMVMSGLYFMKDLPFTQVYLHSTVLDAQGRKMSKSLGNGIDPLAVIDQYGADALRFSIISLAPIGQNILLDMDKFKIGSRFANKIWNASRYLLMNLEEQYVRKLEEIEPDLAGQWILSEYNITIDAVNRAFEQFKFNEAANALYTFFWNSYCDWYIELSKIHLYGEDEEAKISTTTILVTILDGTLRLLHPIMPFITEEIWHKLPNTGDSIMISEYPQSQSQWINDQATITMNIIQSIVYQIRNIRGELRLGPERYLDAYVKASNDNMLASIASYSHYIRSIARVQNIEASKDMKKPKICGSGVGAGYEIYVPLEGLIDLDKERARLTKEIEKTSMEMEKVSKKLNNPNFVGKAKPEIVEKEKTKLADYTDTIGRLKKNLSMIS